MTDGYNNYLLGEEDEANENNIFSNQNNHKSKGNVKSSYDDLDSNLINYEISNENEIDSLFDSSKKDNTNNTSTLKLSNECQCCKNKFDKTTNIPYLLKCGHSFCIKCINQYFSREDGISCPFDGLVGKSLNDLTPFKNLIKSHSKNYSNANIISKQINLDNELPPRPNYCRIHRDQKLSHLVVDTNEIICVHCAFERIKGNPNFEIIDINEKYNEFRKGASNLIDNSQKNIDLIKNTMIMVKKNKENESKKITNFYDNIISYLTSKKKENLETINKIYNENNKELKQKMEYLEEIIEQSEEYIKSLNLNDGDINKNYSNAVNNFGLINDLHKSNNEENNKLKYVKFINETENKVKDYLKDISVIKVINRLVKNIKDDYKNNNNEISVFNDLSKETSPIPSINTYNDIMKIQQERNTSYNLLPETFETFNSMLIKKINTYKKYPRKKSNKSSSNIKYNHPQNVISNYNKSVNITQSGTTKSVNNLFNNNYVTNKLAKNYCTDSTIIKNKTKNLKKREKYNTFSGMCKTPLLRKRNEGKNNNNNNNNNTFITGSTYGNNNNSLLVNYFEMKKNNKENEKENKVKSSPKNVNILNNFYNLNCSNEEKTKVKKCDNFCNSVRNTNNIIYYDTNRSYAFNNSVNNLINCEQKLNNKILNFN